MTIVEFYNVAIVIYLKAAGSVSSLRGRKRGLMSRERKLAAILFLLNI